jgi:hypothetical protein
MQLFIEPIKAVVINIGNALPKLFVVLVVLVAGWLIAKLLKNGINKLLKVIKVEQLADSLGVNNFLAKGEIKYTFCELISIFVYWMFLLIVVILALDIFGLSMASSVFDKVVSYIPNVIAALFILVIGIFAATLLGATATATLANAGIIQAKLLGKIAEVIVVIFAVSAFFEQLGIAKATVLFAVSIIFASLGLAFALAFGLGCKDAAGRIFEEFLFKLKTKK